METALFLPIISILFFVVAAALVFLAFAYRQIAEHFEQLQHRSNREHANANQKASKIVDSAREDAHEILEKSEQKAQEIVISAEFFTAASQEELGNKLQEATKKHVSEYSQMLATFRQDLSKTFRSMSQELSSGADQELATFRQNIQEQTKRAESEFNQQMSKNFQLAQEEVTTYKQLMMKKVDQQTHDIVQQVILEVVPKVITPKDNETLVIQALTEAKQSHAI